MAKLIKDNIAIVNISELDDNLNLSPKHYINKLKGKKSYILKGGRYVLCKTDSDKKKAEYYTPEQVRKINNLLIAKKYIDKEIEFIKKEKK